MTKLRHSALYMPADQAKIFAKVETVAADMVIFDLEDAVAPSQKEQARENLRDYFSAYPNSRKERLIRINALETDYFTEDLLCARKCAPDGILIPKINTADEARQIRLMLGETDAPETITLWAMLETAQGVLNVHNLANPHRSGLEGLILGTNDLTLETGMMAGPNRQNHLPWMVQCVLAAKANGTTLLDGVYNNFSDDKGLGEEASQACGLGFEGKTAIHPKQIAIINDCFAPDSTSIDRANAIKQAFDQPENADKGAIQINGEMIERLHLNQALKTLALINAIKQRNIL